MLFRRECNKINLGLSCRWRIGEFWCCVLFYHGGVEAILLLRVRGIYSWRFNRRWWRKKKKRRD